MSNPPFPEPRTVINGRNYWDNGQIRRYLAESRGEAAPEPQPDDDHLVGSAEVRRRLGNVSLMTIWRRRQRTAAAQGA